MAIRPTKPRTAIIEEVKESFKNVAFDSRNIFGFIAIIAFAIYKIFGNPDNDYWSGFYFCTVNSTFIWACWLVMKFYRDKLLRIFMKILMGISLAEFALNIISFFDVDFFNKINRSYEAGAIVVSCVLIFLIYKANGLVKR